MGDVMGCGRPSGYSQELADLICERLADGHSLRAICEAEGMPSRSMVFRWLDAYPEFGDQYARAREDQAESLADEIVAIADQMPPMTDSGSTDSGHVSWQKNRIEARKWVAAKLKPKKYSDKIQQEVSGPNGGPIQSVSEIVVTFTSADENQG